MESIAVIERDGRVSVSGFTGAVPWWSFTKTAIAAAAMILVSRGTLELDRPVDGEDYTLRQLLRHEAALPDYGGLPEYHAAVAAGEEPWPVDRLIAATASARPDFTPGEGWSYSNIGYLMAGRLIERETGQSLADILRNLVFVPAGSTTARLVRHPAELEDVELGDARDYHPGWVYHGLVVGTVLDACRVLEAISTGRLIASDLLAEMLEGHALPQFRDALHRDPAYGLGLMTSATDPHHHPFGHGGAGPGSTLAVFALRGRVAGAWASESEMLRPEATVFELLAHD